MRNVTIILPTRNRYKKLTKMLTSVPNKPYINTVIGIDNELETHKFLNSAGFLNVHWETFWNENSNDPYGAVYIRNYLIKTYCSDGCLYATDDIIFTEGSIERVLQTFNERFPDDDGVVGMMQKPGKNFHPTGVALVGKKFLHRYPEMQLFCPEYFHFSCGEVYDLALKYNKFYQDTEAWVEHYHPCTFVKEQDQTHLDARIYKNNDMKVISDHKQRNYIWGDTNQPKGEVDEK